MGILNFFKGENQDARSENINKGIKAEGRSTLAGMEEKGAESSVDMTNAIEIETDEERAERPERAERVAKGLQAIMEQYGVTVGELQGKEKFFREMLLTKGFLKSVHERDLMSTKEMVTSAVDHLATTQAAEDFAKKTARQIN
jgi:hypothetical protein